MKKPFALLICACLTFSMSGCTLGDMITSYIEDDDTPKTEASAENHRVYMDEIAGTLQDFSGSRLTLQKNEQAYTFDVSHATLECHKGMITGDEISVIYEGQLSDTDTSTVKALKVVDEFHKKIQLEEQTATGKIQNLTPNTITLKNKKGKTTTYPITGTKQYYQNGIRTGNWVYLHFKGTLPTAASADANVLNASHLKVLSISDVEPFSIPEKTPSEASQKEAKEKQFHAEIQSISINKLTVLPAGSQTPLTVDLSQIPVSLKGGASPGSYVNISYTGELKENTLEGITVTAVDGEDPETIAVRNLSSTITGTIVGSTANTVTLQTGDGALVTCFTENAQDSSTSGLAAGAGIRITFNPTLSQASNIYTSVKIQDA